MVRDNARDSGSANTTQEIALCEVPDTIWEAALKTKGQAFLPIHLEGYGQEVWLFLPNPQQWQLARWEVATRSCRPPTGPLPPPPPVQ